jgi:hypothetical protein
LFKISKEKSDIKDVSDDDQDSPKKSIKLSNNSSKLGTKKQKTAKSESDEEDSIPSIFTDKKFFISKTAKNISQLKRYIIAYDGEVSESAEDATHVVLASYDEKVIFNIIKENIFNILFHLRFYN